MSPTASPSTAETSAETSAATSASPLLRAFQVLAALSVLNVLAQFITAGQLFPSGGPKELHAAGAIVLHVISGLAAVAAVVLWRQSRLGIGITVLAIVVFGYTFIQAAIGGYNTLYVHVPGAMLLTAGVVWLLVWSLRPVRR